MGVLTIPLEAAEPCKEVSIQEEKELQCEVNNNITDLKNKPRGNKCGHNPLQFRIYQNVKHKRRPKFIQRLQARLQRFISKLSFRSERREAIQLVLSCIIDYTDIITLQFCDGKKPLSYNFIAKQTKLELQRVKRTIKELDKAGYFTISERSKKRSDGSYCGLIAIKKLTVKFFKAMDISYHDLRSQQDATIKYRSIKKFFVAEPRSKTRKPKSAKSFIDLAKEILQD